MILGTQLIGGREAASKHGHFHAVNSSDGKPLSPAFGEADPAEVDEAMRAADSAFDAMRHASAEKRANFLEFLAEEILALGDVLLQRAFAETALPMARLTGERGRAVNQCRQFAALIREGSWAHLSVDHAQPDRKMLVPVGPIVVFGASNFPFAIGVVGTDTVSAFAAGCSVVVKGHPAHPGTCELLGRCVMAALQKAELPEAAFSLLQGRSNDLGRALVEHPLTQAVAFTGSLKGGRALMDLAAARPHPIPVYAEMGSINPVFLLPGAMKERAAKIAEAYVGSVTMGVGQFCTNPAVVLGLEGSDLQEFLQGAAQHAALVPAQTMLHRGICEAYEAGTAVWSTLEEVSLVAEGAQGSSQDGQATCRIFTTSLEQLEANEELRREVFGPCSIVTRCRDAGDMLRFARALEGQLTASIHGTPEDLRQHAELIRILERKVGRIIFNGFGTGIEPCPSMHHGGPYPAASHSFFTSIGVDSILRFVRPVCYQGFPQDCLPSTLTDANPDKAMRLINGSLTRDAQV
jgi:NADP-dependent aldehyde dehydrogenase